MSDANDSKELDKYGVWVKDAPKDIAGEDLPENALDDIDAPSDDDMFNDIDFPMTAEDLDKKSGDAEISDIDIDIDIPSGDDLFEEPAAEKEGDTTLSPDELSNITDGMDGGEDENKDTTLSADELSNITGEMEGAADENADTTLSADELMNITGGEEIPTEDAAPEADGMDDFNIDGLDITDETPAAEEAATAPAAEPATEEISLDDIPDGEIDLDDFMSDSPSSGGAASAPDGDVDLSAFMDGDDGDVDLSAFMDDAPAAKKEPKPEEITDEKSLDIDVSFDDSAEGLAQDDPSEKEEEPAAESEAPKESLPSDDMFDSFGDEGDKKPAASSAETSGEEIDLSEFGFDDDDANIGMTAGPDSGTEAKKEVVDYDMKVSADDDSKTPSVQDVVMGNIESSDETEIEEGAAVESNVSAEAAGGQSLEMNEKGKEILGQIMSELSSLKDEIKNLKDGFAELKDRPTRAAENASIPAADAEAEKEENTGFFSGDDDSDDTIALSGNELTNILSSAEFSTEEAAEEPAAEAPVIEETIAEEPAVEEPVIEETVAEEPVVEEIAEPEFEETSIGGEDITMELSDSDMEEPKIESSEITPEDLAGTTDEFGEENVLPEEISVPKAEDDITVESAGNDLMDSVVNTDESFEEPQETLNGEAIDEIMQDDLSISESLDDEKIGYMEQDSALAEEPTALEESDVVSVDDIVKENVSLQEESDDGVAIGVGDDIHAAFEEADATESEIADTALAEKDAYESSVSDIMQDNVSLQADDDGVAIGVGDDIHAAFEEADATESDIVDNALAEKDAYENSKTLEEEFNLDDGDGEEAIPDTLDPSLLAEPAAAEESSDDEIDMSVFDEPTLEETPSEAPVEEPSVTETDFAADTFEETAVEEPVLSEPAIEEPAAEPTVASEPTAAVVGAAAAATAVGAAAASASKLDTTTISKDLKTEIVSVLSYMDQLLENLPEDKITEFAKSEHFVTYKKLFDELGLS